MNIEIQIEIIWHIRDDHLSVARGKLSSVVCDSAIVVLILCYYLNGCWENIKSNALSWNKATAVKIIMDAS